jgi:hypothetical protein
MSVVAMPVPVVHEEVHRGTGQQEEVWQSAEQVRAVLGP